MMIRLLLAAVLGVVAISSQVTIADDEVRQQAADLAPPVHVLAGGKPLEVDGFPAPFVGDFDGDGINDLLVGQFTLGRLRIYHNAGTNADPRFDTFEWFMAGGQPACVPYCCRAAFTPQLVDFDGDGRTDILTGSGIGGEVFLFRRQSDGTFAAAEVLENKAGEVLMARVGTDGNMPRRYNSTALAYDWDDDNDLDLLLGVSPLWLVLNEGTVAAPSLDAGRLVQCEGKPVLGGLGSPHMADWDGDGLDDLIAGLKLDIVWYRNVGDHTNPRFAPPQLLVPRTTDSPAHDLNAGIPGVFHAFCVADFNADGRLDLLVGDRFWKEHDAKGDQPQQTEEQRQQAAALHDQYGQLTSKVPQGESRGDRIARYRQLLRVWQDMELLESRSLEQRGHVWLYQRL